MCIFHCNILRSKVADNILYQLAQELDVDNLLISKQCRDWDPNSWSTNSLGTAAFWAYKKQKASVRSNGRGRGFVWVKCRDITFYSCNLTPNKSIQDFHNKINHLEESVLNPIIIVGGDFKARAVKLWILSTNSRGKYILDYAARGGLVMLKESNTPTFWHPWQRGTILNIILASESPSRISNWRVVYQ